VFATDAILATLMTGPRSAYSWDIIVQVSKLLLCHDLVTMVLVERGRWGSSIIFIAMYS